MSTQTTTSKSWIFSESGYPATLKLSSLPVPSTPASPTHLLIKPHAVSLNPVDIQLMNLPFNNLPSFVPVFGVFAGPKIPGRDFSGEVIAAGSQSGFKQGDKVFGISMGIPGTGFLAEIISVDVKPGGGANIIEKPAHFSYVQAGSLPCVWLTAKTAVEKAVPFCKKSSTAANKVVILGGSSGTGIYMVKLAKKKGWTVLSSCSGRNIDFVKSLGADEVVDYTTGSDAVVNAVKAFKPDAILDCVGGTETIGLAPQYVTIVGDKTSRDTMGGAALYLTKPMMLLRWFLGYVGVGHSYECINMTNSAEYLKEAGSLASDEVVIDSTFPFGQVKEAFERLNTGRARGKVVVEVAGTL